MKTWPQGDSNIFLTNIPNFPKIPRDIKWLRELPSPPPLGVASDRVSSCNTSQDTLRSIPRYLFLGTDEPSSDAGPATNELSTWGKYTYLEPGIDG